MSKEIPSWQELSKSKNPLGELAATCYDAASAVLIETHPDRVANTQIETSPVTGANGITVFLRGSVGENQGITNVKLIRREGEGDETRDAIACTLSKNRFSGDTTMQQNYSQVYELFIAYGYARAIEFACNTSNTHAK